VGEGEEIGSNAFGVHASPFPGVPSPLGVFWEQLIYYEANSGRVCR
jgi:hypothetical protein